MTEEKIKPIKNFRLGNISASLWKKEIKINDKKSTIFNVSIERNYKNKDDEWKKTNNYNLNDLFKLKILVEDIFKYALTETKEEKK